MSNYRYFINGNIEVFPKNAGTHSYDYSRRDDIVFERKLKTAFVFNYTDNTFDFKNQETIDKAEQINFSIEKNCSGTDAVVFEATFCIMEGEFDDDKCTFSIELVLKEYTIPDLEVNVLNSPLVNTGTSVGVYAGSGGAERNYTKGHHFKDVVLMVAQEANRSIIGIISDFFQINPINVSGFCLPGVVNNYTALIFCALSDIQEPVPSDPARREVITFKTLMDDLRTIFDIYYFVENNYLRLEHRIYFEKTTGLDLTTTNYVKYLKGSHKYKYDLDSLPTSQEIKIIGTDKFARATFPNVGKITKKENQKSLQTGKIRTDYRKIRYITGGASEPGLFLFATTLTGGKYRMVEDIHGNNYTLDPLFLLTNIHTYGRPSLFAQIESLYVNQAIADNNYYRNGGFIFKDTLPIKEQAEISVPLCCENDFDPLQKIITDIGEGFVDKANYSAKESLLKLTLKYKIDDTIVFLPSDIPELDLWLKHNSGITQSGGLVSQWNDASGHNRHATQAVGADKPTYNAITGNIDFSATDHLATPAFILFPNKRGSVFILYEGLNGSGQIIISTNTGGASNTSFDFSFNGAPSYESLNNGPAAYYPLVNIWTTSTPTTVGLYNINRESNTDLRCMHNGILPYPELNPITIPNTQMVSAPFVVGYNAPINLYGGPAGTLTIKEIIVFGRALTISEIKKVEFYLVKKGIYGINP